MNHSNRSHAQLRTQTKILSVTNPVTVQRNQSSNRQKESRRVQTEALRRL